MYADALKDYFGVNTFRYSIQDSVGYNSLKFSSDIHQKPTLEEFNQIVENYKNVVLPLKILRIERDRLLTASDWRMTKDYPYADQLDWEDYRFELRELPQRIENGEVPAPTLDENGMLVFDEWPLKPGENA